MTRHRAIGSLLLGGCAVGLAAVLVATAVSVVTGQGQAVAATPQRPPPAGEGWVNSTLRQMTLEQKVGQLFVTYVYGATPDTVDTRNRGPHGVDTPAEVIRRYHLGGVIYFAWSDNLANPRQVAELSNGVQQVAMRSGARLPLLISTDHEQGIVTRLPTPASPMPGSMALGAGSVGADRRTDDARAAAAVAGRELRSTGINTDYAPVADVNINPDNPVIGVRSFSDDPELAADLVAAQVDGYQRFAPAWQTVSATAKHFPGHGDTDVDSHTGLPEISHDLQEWEELDAPPFRAAIDAGIDSIMTAHIVMPNLDQAEDPATLSRPILTGLLRERLGFNGVVVTDSLGMAGVRTKYGDDRVPVLALQAGVDMLLMPPDTGLAYDSVLAAVRSGELTERRIDQSVRRILRMKWNRGMVARPLVDPAQAQRVVGAPEHLAVAREVTDRTVTALSNDDGVLPLTDGNGRGVLVTGWGVTTGENLANQFAARGWLANALSTGSVPSEATVAAAVQAAAGKDLVVVLANAEPGSGQTRPGNRAAQARLVRALADTGVPVVAVAVRDPYDSAHVAGTGTWLATYSYTTLAVESLAKVLHGELPAAGRLPMTVPTADGSDVLYPFGHGLDLTR